MEIKKNLNEDLTATIEIQVAKSDIEETVEKKLREYRRKANVPGFRPGNVPFGLIKKMYGNSVLIDELNHFVGESLMKFIEDEKMDIIGDPLPSDKQEQIDITTQENFTFLFDVAPKPEFEIKLSKRDKINKYDILVDDKMLESTINSYRRSFGEFVKVEKSGENSNLSVSAVQLNEQSEINPDGISVEKTSVLISNIKDEVIKKNLIGVEENTIVDIDIEKAFENNKSEIAAFLHQKKEDIEGIYPVFRLTILEIKDFVEAELNQELYDKIFGEGVITSEEEFKNKIREQIKENFKQNLDYKLLIDIKEKFLSKTEIQLPEEFLKKWVKTINKELTEEQIESEFHHFLDDLRWSLIKGKIAKENEIKVEPDDLFAEAANLIKNQFRMYGLNDVPEEYLTKYANDILKNKDEVEKLYQQILERKVVEFVSDQIKLELKEITQEEFYDLFK